MGILSLSTDLAQQNLEQATSFKVQKMAMNGMQEQGAALVKMMESATTVIRDPMLGNNVNFLA
jgi:Cys-tRNA synthase (O-phospho-L-seryl-tRNA:Cys-tRNA synthase)